MPRRYFSLSLDLIAIFCLLAGVLAISAGLKNQQVLASNPTARDVVFLIWIGVGLSGISLGVWFRSEICIFLLCCALHFLGWHQLHGLIGDLKTPTSPIEVYLLNASLGLMMVGLGYWLLLRHCSTTLSATASQDDKGAR